MHFYAVSGAELIAGEWGYGIRAQRDVIWRVFLESEVY